MSWEAFRLTSKTPAELLCVMSPAGVDALVRDALMDCWRSLPEESRTIDAWRERARKTFDRNLKVWAKIRKPNPQAFFSDLAPYPSDGHLRQAMVLTWMMLPRAGGRDIRDTHKIIRAIFDRNMQSWELDYRTFSPAPPRKARKKPSAKPRARKLTSRKK